MGLLSGLWLVFSTPAYLYGIKPVDWQAEWELGREQDIKRTMSRVLPGQDLTGIDFVPQAKSGLMAALMGGVFFTIWGFSAWYTAQSLEWTETGLHVRSLREDEIFSISDITRVELALLALMLRPEPKLSIPEAALPSEPYEVIRT